MNFEQLKAVIAEFANRQDLETMIPTFIRLTESRLRRDLRDVTRMTDRAEAMVHGEYFPLPCDWCETVKVIADGSVLRLADSFNIERVELSGGPKYYRHVGDQMQLLPPAGEEPIRFVMEYLAFPDGLSDENPTNWVLDTYPDIYIYGAMLQIEPFLHDDAPVPLWSQAYGEAISAANISSQKAKASGSALRLQRHGVA
jgi:hypothetical protein